MVDNFDIIKPLLTFSSEDDFYYLQILQRKKENNTLNSNSRVIKNYYISSLDYLENRKEEITTLCTVFNARACLRLQPRSYKKVAFRAMRRGEKCESQVDLYIKLCCMLYPENEEK